MTVTVLVIDGHVPPDPATENSRWIAGATCSRLGGRALLLADANAVRAVVENSATPDVAGLVLCGHADGGKEVLLRHNQHHARDADWQRRYDETSEQGAFYGTDGNAVLDSDNLAYLAAKRWVHAIGCELAFALPDLAVGHGSIAFAAYEQRLVPEFTPGTLPPAAEKLLAHVVTATTLSMTDGCFDQVTLVSNAREAADELLGWMDDTPEGEAWAATQPALGPVGLVKFAMQLSSALRVVVSHDPERSRS